MVQITVIVGCNIATCNFGFNPKMVQITEWGFATHCSSGHLFQSQNGTDYRMGLCYSL